MNYNVNKYKERHGKNIVSATQLPAIGAWEDVEEVLVWCEQNGLDYQSGKNETLEFQDSLRQWQIVNPLEWIVKKNDNDFLVFNDSTFKTIYKKWYNLQTPGTNSTN